MMEMERSRLLEALRAIAWNISRDAPGWGSPGALGCDWPPRPWSCTGRAGCGPAVDNHPTAAEGAIIARHRGQPDEGRKKGVGVFRQAALEGDLRRLAPPRSVNTRGVAMKTSLPLEAEAHGEGRRATIGWASSVTTRNDVTL
jgi:hypothetical protein